MLFLTEQNLLYCRYIQSIISIKRGIISKCIIIDIRLDYNMLFTVQYFWFKTFCTLHQEYILIKAEPAMDGTKDFLRNFYHNFHNRLV